MIYRKGKIVAEATGESYHGPVTRGMFTHRHWYSLRVTRVGNKFRLFVYGGQILEFEDPDPIEAPLHPCVWTYKMGIMVGRVRISAENIDDATTPWSVRPDNARAKFTDDIAKAYP